MDLRKKDGNVPHNRGCGELVALVLVTAFVLAVLVVGAAAGHGVG